MEEADQVCERVAIFDHGEIRVLGTPSSLKAMLPATETIEVSFTTAPPAWADAVAHLHAVETVQVQNGTCRIQSRDRAATLAALLQAARDQGVAISSLVLRGNTLEDVFIYFTGRELRDEAGKLRVDQRLLQG